MSAKVPFPWKTVGGYDFYEVVSALQKSIRRGLEDDALFWASELYLSDYAAHAWRRFIIIASEDIGISDSNVFVQIKALHEVWKDRKAEGDAKLFFIHALLILVRAPKSRIVDHALIVYLEGERKYRDIPGYALDLHTERGKAMGHGNEDFFEEGAKLENSTLPDPYRERAKEIRKKKLA